MLLVAFCSKPVLCSFPFFHFLAVGSFLLKKDGTPAKKAGRAKGSKGRGYNYHSKTKAKLDAKRVVREKQKRVDAVEAKLHRQRKTLNNSKQT